MVLICGLHENVNALFGGGEASLSSHILQIEHALGKVYFIIWFIFFRPVWPGAGLAILDSRIEYSS